MYLSSINCHFYELHSEVICFAIYWYTWKNMSASIEALLPLCRRAVSLYELGIVCQWDRLGYSMLIPSVSSRASYPIPLDDIVHFVFPTQVRDSSTDWKFLYSKFCDSLSSSSCRDGIEFAKWGLVVYFVSHCSCRKLHCGVGISIFLVWSGPAGKSLWSISRVFFHTSSMLSPSFRCPIFLNPYLARFRCHFLQIH